MKAENMSIKEIIKLKDALLEHHTKDEIVEGNIDFSLVSSDLLPEDWQGSEVLKNNIIHVAIRNYSGSIENISIQ